jgi:sigma-B regulation protein RsbU (phosphoserine phosphatase)
MESINAYLSENNVSNIFVTMFIGLLNLQTGCLTYCNAGHNPPVVVLGTLCNALPVAPNIPLAVKKGFVYREQNFTLLNSDALLLYTDGVTEAVGANQELYGTQRLSTVVTQHSKALSSDVVEAVLADIKRHTAAQEQSDDMAIMMIRYHKPQTLHQECITLLNKVEELSKVVKLVERIGAQLTLPPTLVMNLNIALEEAITNIMHYAYKGQPSEREITLATSLNGNKLIFELTDSGVEFDPTQKADPCLTLPAEERPIGGLGIFIIKQMMDQVTYQRMKNQNVLTLTKIIDK